VDTPKNYRIKLIAVDYDWDYSNDSELRTFTEAIDWQDVDEKLYVDIQYSIKNKHKLGNKDPFKGKNLILIEEILPIKADLINFISLVKEETRKEDIAREKRNAAIKIKKETSDQKLLERKKKAFEKLKKELGDE